jgi:hypothetical protein
MTLTDELCRSFFDVWHHLDPVSAARFDPQAPVPVLAAFDRPTVRQHVAALRAIGAAAEALEATTLEEEIDQTLLLDAIRGVEHQFTAEAGQLGDPAFWASRLAETIERRPGDETLLDAIPTWAEAAAAELVKPPLFGLETGLALLEWAAASLDSAIWRRTRDSTVAGARAALEALAASLRRAAPAADAGTAGIGAAAVDWRLHYEYGLNLGGVEALRAVARLAGSGEPGTGNGEPATAPPPPSPVPGPPSPVPSSPPSAPPSLSSYHRLIDPDAYHRVLPAGALGPSRLEVWAAEPERDAAILAARYGPGGVGGLLAARAGGESEIRRRFASAGLVAGWALYAEARARGESGPETARVLSGDLHRRVLVAAVDLAIHRRQLAPAAAVGRLAERLPLPRATLLAEVRRVTLHPLEAAGSVLTWREWEALGKLWPGGPEPMAAAVTGGGLSSPALVRWRHGVEG